MATIEEVAAELSRLRTRVEATEAVLAIHELKARYADLVDRRFVKGAMADDDFVAVLADDIAATFTDDGVWDGGTALGRAYGRDEIAARMRTSTLTFARHFFVKPRIHVDGDRAQGRWDILSPCTTADGTPHWMSGYEDDEYVRTPEGSWLHRRMKLTTVFMAPATEGWHRIFV
jgi:hypothetical protein